MSLAQSLYSPSALALHADLLYVADFFSASSGPGTIQSLPKAGGSATVLLDAVDVRGMVAGPNGELLVDGQREGAYNQVPFVLSSSGEVTDLVTGAHSDLTALTASGVYAVWSHFGGVGAYEFASGNVLPLGGLSADGVAIVGDEVLAVSSDGLVAISLPDMALEVLLPALDLRAVVADDTYAYLFTNGTNEILRWTR